MTACAVLVALSEHEGLGMYVELGAALARAAAGDLTHGVVIGRVHHAGDLLLHPSVQQVGTVDEWLLGLGP